MDVNGEVKLFCFFRGGRAGGSDQGMGWGSGVARFAVGG